MSTKLIKQVFITFLIGFTIGFIFFYGVLACASSEEEDEQYIASMVSISQPVTQTVYTVLAQGFNHIGIKGTAAFISSVNQSLQMLMRGTSSVVDTNSVGYQLVNDIDNGSYFLGDGVLCTLIQQGCRHSMDIYNPSQVASVDTMGFIRSYGAATVHTTGEAYNYADEPMTIPPHITLGHELVHAWRAQTGYFISSLGPHGAVGANIRVLMDELETVFGGIWGNVAHVTLITENRLRQFMNFPQRQRYGQTTPANYFNNINNYFTRNGLTAQDAIFKTQFYVLGAAISLSAAFALN